MKISISISLLMIMPLFTFFPNLQKENIHGEWFSPDMENASIQVYTGKDGYIEGKIINCDKKEWIGEIILKKVKYKKSNNRWEGEIYSLKKKTSIKAKLSLTKDQQLKIVGSKWLISKTFYWSRK